MTQIILKNDELVPSQGFEHLEGWDKWQHGDSWGYSWKYEAASFEIYYFECPPKANVNYEINKGTPAGYLCRNSWEYGTIITRGHATAKDCLAAATTILKQIMNSPKGLPGSPVLDLHERNEPMPSPRHSK